MLGAVPIEVSLDLPRDDVALGLVLAEGVTASAAGPSLRAAIDECVRQRHAELSPELDARRKACRDILRNGSYKPTGRGKPANEYLLRAAREGTFPSINGLVDSNNLVSLEHMVPISVWDLDLSPSPRFKFTLGAPGESYVFNQAGQELALTDLICGHVLDADHTPNASEAAWVPIVNPIKDCLRTKTTASTTRVAAALYCPLGQVSAEAIESMAAELAGWLSTCGESSATDHAVLLPDQTLSLGHDS